MTAMKTTKFNLLKQALNEFNVPIFEKEQNVIDKLLSLVNPLLNKDNTKEELDQFIQEVKSLATKVESITIGTLLLISYIRGNKSNDIAEIKLVARLKQMIALNESEVELNDKDLDILKREIPKLELTSDLKYQILDCLELIDRD